MHFLSRLSPLIAVALLGALHTDLMVGASDASALFSEINKGGFKLRKVPESERRDNSAPKVEEDAKVNIISKAPKAVGGHTSDTSEVPARVPTPVRPTGDPGSLLGDSVFANILKRQRQRAESDGAVKETNGSSVSTTTPVVKRTASSGRSGHQQKAEEQAEPKSSVKKESASKTKPTTSTKKTAESKIETTSTDSKKTSTRKESAKEVTKKQQKNKQAANKAPKNAKDAEQPNDRDSNGESGSEMTDITLQETGNGQNKPVVNASPADSPANVVRATSAAGDNSWSAGTKLAVIVSSSLVIISGSLGIFYVVKLKSRAKPFEESA